VAQISIHEVLFAPFPMISKSKGRHRRPQAGKRSSD
jgi:hypothetical protein